MTRTAVGVLLCLLVVATAAPAVAAGAQDPPDRCRSGPDGVGDVTLLEGLATTPRVTVVPHEATVFRRETVVLLVCVVNPRENDEPMELGLEIWHSGTQSDLPVVVVGRSVTPAADEELWVHPLAVRTRGGVGGYLTVGELVPGEGAQYAVVLRDAPAPGTYEFRARAYRETPPDVVRHASVTVRNRPCSAACVARTLMTTPVVFVNRNFDALVAVLGLALAFFGRKRIWAALGHLRRAGTELYRQLRSREP